jgi:hypothetical protein
MAKSTKPRSTAHETAPRPTRAKKPPATPDTTTIEAGTFASATLETTTRPPLTHDVIAMRAYELYLGDGAPQGRELEHWLRAESELRDRAPRN